MERQTLGSHIIDWCRYVSRNGLRTNHGFLILCGSIILLIYGVTLLVFLGDITIHGSSSAFMNTCFLYLGLAGLWKQQETLKQERVYPDDRIIGYALLLTGTIGFFLLRSSFSLQALCAMLIVMGMLLSQFGLVMIRRHWRFIGFIIVGLYPNIINLATQTWKFATPHNLLELLMANLGSQGLRLLGYESIAQEQFIKLGPGAVEVAFGCNGFHMSFVLGMAGFIVGQFMQLSVRKTVLLIIGGVTLALSLNVPRVMMLAIASVYWGKQSFDFWHGSIGGQIFAGILFTIYYYLAMWIIDRKPNVKASRSIV